MNGYDASNRFLLLFSVIGFALIIKFFFVRRLTALSLGKCVLADFVMNLVSVLVGIILIPAAIFVWQLSLGTILENYLNIGTFNLGAAIAPFVTRTVILLVAIAVLAWLETITLRVIFNQGDFGQESHWKFFGQLCVANAFVIGFAFGIMSVHFTWTRHKNFVTPDFIGSCIDTGILFAIGIAGLIYYPHRFAKDVESGKYSEGEGKARLKKIKLACYAVIVLGLVNASKFIGLTNNNSSNVKYASYNDNVGITLQVDGTQIILPAGWRKIDFPTNLYVQQGAANPKKGIVIVAGVTKSDQSIEHFAVTLSPGLNQEILSRKNLEISGFSTLEIDGNRTNQKSGKKEFVRTFIFAGSDSREIVTISYGSSSEDIFQDQSLVDFIQRPPKPN